MYNNENTGRLRARLVSNAERPQEGKPKPRYEKGLNVIYASYTHVIENGSHGGCILLEGQEVQIKTVHGPCWDIQAGCWDPNSNLYDIEWSDGDKTRTASMIYQLQLVLKSEWSGPSADESLRLLREMIDFHILDIT